MGSILPKNHNTMTPINYHKRYHEPRRIPAKPSEQPRSQKHDLGPLLLMKMNVGERGRMPDWCPWPAVAYSHNYLNLSSFYPSIAADTSRNTSKMTRVSSSQK